MKITFGAVLLIAIIVAAFFFFRSKTGKRVKTRATGTATEAIIKDASTPEGAKAIITKLLMLKRISIIRQIRSIHRCLARSLLMRSSFEHYKKKICSLI
ncbi:hypothetical protein DW953_04580 [Ruminococcus sp. AM45-2]|nr:hypothetical protein DW953_04580 [Ruminococcus sp. AM45-2]